MNTAHKIIVSVLRSKGNSVYCGNLWCLHCPLNDTCIPDGIPFKLPMDSSFRYALAKHYVMDNPKDFLDVLL